MLQCISTIIQCSTSGFCYITAKYNMVFQAADFDIIKDTLYFPLTGEPWWRHQMETFSALLAICEGNSPVPGEFPTQRPVTRSFDVYFDLRPNKWLSKQSWGWWFETLSCSLWRHRNGHGVSYMCIFGSKWPDRDITAPRCIMLEVVYIHVSTGKGSTSTSCVKCFLPTTMRMLYFCLTQCGWKPTEI